MKFNCASCRYYSAKSCHRWPPIGFEDTAAPPHAIFPPVALTDWCGEYAEHPVDMTMPGPGEAIETEYTAATFSDKPEVWTKEKIDTFNRMTADNPEIAARLREEASKPRRGRPRRG